MKTFDDYGPTTDHPHDPRNSLTDAEEEYETLLEVLDSVSGKVAAATWALQKSKDPTDHVVALLIDEIVDALGGIPPYRG